MRDLIMRSARTAPLWVADDVGQVRRRGGGAGDGGGQGDPANARAAEQRVTRERDQARERAEAAERELQALKDKDKDETTKEREKREAAEQKAASAIERAEKAEVRAKLVLRAGTHTAATQAVVDLSEAKLLDLKEATDEELDVHLKETVTKYGLPAPGGDGGPGGFGQPAGQGGAGGGGKGGQGAGSGNRDEGATGDPKKDWRRGIGLGILRTGERAGIMAPPGADSDD